jgi:hypothetical protein
MARKLVRHERHRPTKIVPVATGRAEVRIPNEGGHPKKSPNLVKVSPLLEAYAEEAPRFSRRALSEVEAQPVNP